MAIIIKRRRRFTRGTRVGIPESQLTTWSNQGATATARDTYASVRKALEGLTVPADEYSVYLQGSYRNDTNIYADMDVDVVVQLNDQFMYDISDLPSANQTLFDGAYRNASYSWRDFRRDVLIALQAYYGASRVEEHNYVLKVVPRPGRLAADVLVCTTFFEYSAFQSTSNYKRVEGVAFLTSKEAHPRRVVNYPKQHYDNGVAMNQRTDDWYKRTIRIFKNARNYLIEQGRIKASLAPSYFIESLLYKVPDHLFTTSYAGTLERVLTWLSTANFEKFYCRNELVWLFGNSSEQWSIKDAQAFRDAMIELWGNW
jgi:hypothetical protein